MGVDVVVSKPILVEFLNKIVHYCDLMGHSNDSEKRLNTTNMTLKEYLKSTDHS